METRGVNWKVLLAFLIAGIALLLLIGCAGPTRDGEPAGWMEVRLEAGASAEGVKSFRDPEGQILWFREPVWFPLTFVGRSVGTNGEPVVSFEVASSHREAFRSMTADHVGSRMGVFAGGELLVAPVIQTAMNGSGVLSGPGWDAADCTQVRRALRSHRPPQGVVDALPSGG